MQHFTLKFSRYTLVCALFALGGLACAGETNDEEPSLSGVTLALAQATPVPSALAVPEGNKLAFSLRARGTQNYVCKQAADGSYGWTFVEPDALLYGLLGKVAGHHYAGPTWEANDGSTVVGSKVAGVTVDATAIPWLLLQASSHTGHGRMSKVTYVQRLETVGGQALATGCDCAHAGATLDVDYTAKYAFYR